MDQPINSPPQNVTPTPPPTEPPPCTTGNGATPPPLSLTGWLVNNAPLYLILLVSLGFLIYYGGLDYIIRAVMVAIGLGFIIFIHELGHFLAAKWCDVHVQTFSIGFGPALPGCSFVRGETTYKIAAFPLGGFVQMVGEGPEAEEDENYPRSFKNKTVLQRMLIISAGVVMNVLFGAVAFITVYLTVGEDRQTSVIWKVEAGSPAWKAGFRPGCKITRVGDKENPFFDDVTIEAALSRADRSIPFTLEAREGVPAPPSEPISLTPRRDKNNQVPAVGLSSSVELKLPSVAMKKSISQPTSYGSAAAHARALDLKPGDVPVATGESEDKLDRLPEGKDKDPWAELSKRLLAAEGEGFVVRVRGAGGEERMVPAGPVAFDFGDRIIATTDPDTPDKPYNVTPLPLDPEQPAAKGLADPFAFRRRMVALRGKLAVIRVARAKTSSQQGQQVDLAVPPSYHLNFGVRMRMGKVAALRDVSPAGKAGLQVGDVIGKAFLRYTDKGEWEELPKPLDPVRLPDELYFRIHADPAKQRNPNKWQVKFQGTRAEDHNAEAPFETGPMDWDDSWVPGDEVPQMPAAPLAIPQLGLAYRIDSTIAAVEPDSQAEKDGLQVGDEIREIRFRMPGKTPAKEERTWSEWRKMESEHANKEKAYDQWAYFFYTAQRVETGEFEVKVWRATTQLTPPEPAEETRTWWQWIWGTRTEAGFRLTGTPDTTWPQIDRGVQLTSDTRRQVASGLFDAVGMGLDKTWRMTRTIYMSLSSLVTGRIDRRNMGGPVAIATNAFSAAEDVSLFLLFLGVISINLAVVNFLPIPILDGGHMVFLLYEGIVGKPPPESVRTVATYIGLLIILGLMLFVFYNDFDRLGWIPRFLKR